MTFFILIALAILALLGYAASRPDDFSVSRVTSIKAAPERIFPLINDLRAMNSWNPFVLSDPKVKLSYSGPATGKGATCDWDSNGRAGAGQIGISESVPSSRVVMQLDMRKPFAGRNQVTFTLAPADGATSVTWAMTGKNAFIPKLMSLVMNMDKMVGGAFEKGLADLKAKAER